MVKVRVALTELLDGFLASLDLRFAPDGVGISARLGDEELARTAGGG